MTTTTNVAGRTAVRTAPGKLLAVTVTTPPPYGKYSVHDCAGPDQATALNCVFPQNFASADGITLKHGLVVHTQEPGGVFTVVHSS